MSNSDSSQVFHQLKSDTFTTSRGRYKQVFHIHLA
ncbi:Uncharacterised protein [Vibrio cholerae]|nr:Uncharacterised protein [Vibrio cholerae]